MVDPVVFEKTSLAVAHLGLPKDFQLYPVAARGGNNQVYRLGNRDGSFLIKHYFRHPGDPRDRAGTEYAFSRFAWDHGVRSIPRPIGLSRELGIAVYEFVDGGKLAASDLSEAHVLAATSFVSDVNKHRLDPAARALPLASEAQFSIQNHLDRVDYRVRKLSSIQDTDATSREAIAFVSEVLFPKWETIRDFARKKAAREELPLEEDIPDSWRCLSPSDFGFHNALVRRGIPRFIDFEYAGWDDPAKLTCDFFCQVKVPIPRSFLATVIERVSEALPDYQNLKARVELLMPVYQFKWVCIVLNAFVPVDESRRRFSGGVLPDDAHRRLQLELARRLTGDIQ